MAKRMVVDSIIQQILASRRDLTHEEIADMIEEKVKNAKGYFTREIAAQMVASELGVQTPRGDLQPKIMIKNLVSGLTDVTIIGRVIHISSSQRFTRADGTEGAARRLVMADKSGVLKITLWDEKAESEDIKIGHVVKFSHGYVREGLDGKVELNLGTRGEIEVVQEEGMKEEYPTVESFTKRIGEITERERRVNVSGIVQRIFPESVFKRKDESQGRRRELWLRDSTGQIRVVFWNDKVDEVGDFREGHYLQVLNARVQSRLDGGLELHVEETSNVQAATEKTPRLVFLPVSLAKVKEIGEAMRNTSILARVACVANMARFGRSGGATQLSVLLVGDETGSVQLNLWKDKALLSDQISPGDVLLIEGAYAKKRFGRISLNLDEKGSIVINPGVKEAENIPQNVERMVNLADINEEGYVTIQGTVVTKACVREVTTARNERVKVASFELSDNTGKAELFLWRESADTAEKLSVGEHVKIRNIYVSKGSLGELKLSSSMLTSVERPSKHDGNSESR